MLLPSVEGQEGGKWIVIDSGMSAFREPAFYFYPQKLRDCFNLLSISYVHVLAISHLFVVWL